MKDVLARALLLLVVSLSVLWARVYWSATGIDETAAHAHRLGITPQELVQREEQQRQRWLREEMARQELAGPDLGRAVSYREEEEGSDWPGYDRPGGVCRAR